MFAAGQKACGEVEESERLVETLQAEVSALRRRLRERRRSGAGKGSQSLLYHMIRVIFTRTGSQDVCLKSVFCVSAASDEDPPEQKNNLLLHEAVRALFACSPLFHTQTLTLEGFPVRDVRCGVEQDGDVSAAAGLAQRRRSGTARPAASLQEELWETAAREEKRRKTSS